jgi:hypothetical protein
VVLGRGGQAELGEDGGDVAVDGLLPDVERAGDRPVGASALPHLRLADLPAVAVASDLALLVGFGWIAAQLSSGAMTSAPVAPRDPRPAEAGRATAALQGN